MAGKWLEILRSVARSMRSELLAFFSSMERPQDADEAKEMEEEADRVACEALLRGLEEREASCTLICEDLGVRELGGPGPEAPFLLVDPLDGTRNFTRGLPVASISMATCSGRSLSSLETALVMDIFSGREFWAVAGTGAYLGEERISVSRTRDLSKAVVSLDKSRLEGDPSWVISVASKVDATRQLGSAALELCYVASGTLDAHVDLRGRIRPTDVAAGLLIAREAGAWAWVKGQRDPRGELSLEERLLIFVSNPWLFEQMRNLLKPYSWGGMILRGRNVG